MATTPEQRYRIGLRTKLANILPLHPLGTERCANCGHSEPAHPFRGMPEDAEHEGDYNLPCSRCTCPNFAEVINGHAA